MGDRLNRWMGQLNPRRLKCSLGPKEPFWPLRGVIRWPRPLSGWNTGVKRLENQQTEANLNNLGKRDFDWKLCQKTKQTGSKHCTLIGKFVLRGLTVRKVLHTHTQPNINTVHEQRKREARRSSPVLAESETAVGTTKHKSR